MNVMSEVDTAPVPDFEMHDSRPYILSLDAMTDHFATGAANFNGYVVASAVTMDLLPLKDERVGWLVEDMRRTMLARGWGNGQDDAIFAGYVIDKPEPKIEVIDGLHRQKANLRMQSSTAVDLPDHVIETAGRVPIHYASVLPMTRYELLDKRLAKTSNHPQIRTARGGLWSAEIWYESELRQRAPDISPKQAFSMAERRGNKKGHMKLGKGLGLDADLVQDICDWADERATHWDVDASTVHKWIHLVESMSPELVVQMRNTGQGSSDTEGIFHEGWGKAFQNHMSGLQFADVHDYLVRYGEQHELSTQHFSRLVYWIGKGAVEEGGLEDPSSLAEVLDLLEDFDLERLATMEVRSSGDRIRRASDPQLAGARSAHKIAAAVDRFSDALDIRERRDDEAGDEAELTDDERANLEEAAHELGEQQERLTELQRRTAARLRGTPATPKPEQQETGPFNPERYKGRLTSREREVLQEIANERSVAQVGARLFISQTTVGNHLAAIYEKLDARDRTIAVLRAIQTGDITVEGVGGVPSGEAGEAEQYNIFTRGPMAIGEMEEVAGHIRNFVDAALEKPEAISGHDLQRAIQAYDRLNDLGANVIGPLRDKIMQLAEIYNSANIAGTGAKKKPS